jgi:RNA polymerase sigma-70 factor (ECF subfamily)
MKTTGEGWAERLAPGSSDRECALGELRGLLLKGVRAGLSGRSGADDAFIEDTVQVALVRILEHLHKFEGRSAFTTWALAIAKRVAFAELRRKHRISISLEELRENAGLLQVEAASAPDPPRSAALNSLVALTRRLIRTELTPHQRDVLLAGLSAMSQEEIARQMGITRNAVYKLGHDARKALKRAMEAAGYGIEQVCEVLEE